MVVAVVRVVAPLVVLPVVVRVVAVADARVAKALKETELPRPPFAATAQGFAVPVTEVLHSKGLGFVPILGGG